VPPEESIVPKRVFYYEGEEPQSYGIKHLIDSMAEKNVGGEPLVGKRKEGSTRSYEPLSQEGGFLSGTYANA